MTKALIALFLTLANSDAALAEPSPASAPKMVDVPSGALHLKALLWMPKASDPVPAVLFSHGSGGADADHTAGQGPYMHDLLQREEKAHGEAARRHLQFVLLTTEQLDDVLAALSYLKSAPGIDKRRIALVGHSFGGQLTLLAAGGDSSVRAVVTFGAAAGSWEHSQELRNRLTAAVRNTSAPIMLIHAENDYSTAAGRALADELERLHRSPVLKIYPPVGQSKDDGHNLLYLAVPTWENDVFGFLDRHVK